MQLVAASSDCVKLLDLDGNLRYINENGLGLVEIEVFATIDGKPWNVLWPAETHALVASALAEAKTGHVARFTAQAPTEKGNYKWWDVAVSPVYDDAGELIWLLATSRDITKQKQTEESFRIGEQHFRALADNIAQFAWMADAAGSLFWYNQRWFDYTGTTLKDMAGCGWKAVHHPDHLDRVVGKFNKCIANGTIWDDTFPLRAADGSYRWFLSRAMPIRDDKGAVVLWCGTNTDITEQRKSSQRLSQLARLIELSHEAILVWELEGGVVLWNRGCSGLFGYSEAEALGANSFDLLQTSRALSRDLLLALLSDESAWSGELLRIAKDGRQVWVDCRLELIRVGDNQVVLETNRDITGRRHADEVRNLLIGELNHRVKNTLAIVQSLASQTARNSRTIEDFVTGFNGRLQSLSSAHNVLTDTNWTGASIAELVKSQIVVTAGSSERFTIAGPDVILPAQTALQLTLILHELATNAVKHGALSSVAGHVDVNWCLSKEPEKTIVLSWQESGGPIAVAPKARGFGLNLIERSGRLPYLTTRLAFNPNGLFCEIVAKLAEATSEGTPFFDPGRQSARLAAAI